MENPNFNPLKHFKTIEDELKDLEDYPMPGATIYKNPSEPSKLEACIEGPKGTVYEGGKFIIDVKLEGVWPYRLPVSFFRTNIFHPSVIDGAFCNEIVCTYWDDICINWCHKMTLRRLLFLFLQLLEFGQETDSGYVLNHEAQKLYKEDRELYNKTAREWTLMYATQEN